MSQPILGMRRNLDRLDAKLLPTGPSDYGFGNLNPLLVREGNVQGEHFSWTHRHISRQPAATQGQVPDGAGSGKRADVVLHKALHGKASVGANRERHERLADAHILGSALWTRNATDVGGSAGNMCISWRGRLVPTLLYRTQYP